VDAAARLEPRPTRLQSQRDEHRRLISPFVSAKTTLLEGLSCFELVAREERISSVYIERWLPHNALLKHISRGARRGELSPQCLGQLFDRSSYLNNTNFLTKSRSYVGRKKTWRGRHNRGPCPGRRVSQSAAHRTFGLAIFLCPNGPVPNASRRLRGSTHQQRNPPRWSDASSNSGLGSAANRGRLGPGTPPRFLIHDRDSRHGASFDRRVRHLGIRQVRTPVRSPRASAVAERWMRSVRSECLDHVFVFSEVMSGLRRLFGCGQLAQVRRSRSILKPAGSAGGDRSGLRLRLKHLVLGQAE